MVVKKTNHLLHLFQRWSDEARKPDEIWLMFLDRFDDPLFINHYSKVDNLKGIAPQYQGNHVLSDVVHIALYRSKNRLTSACLNTLTS